MLLCTHVVWIAGRLRGRGRRGCCPRKWAEVGARRKRGRTSTSRGPATGVRERLRWQRNAIAALRPLLPSFEEGRVTVFPADRRQRSGSRASSCTLDISKTVSGCVRPRPVSRNCEFTTCATWRRTILFLSGRSGSDHQKIDRPSQSRAGTLRASVARTQNQTVELIARALFRAEHSY